MVGLYTPTAGEVIYEEGTRKTGQMIFQNPYASLNPRHTVRQILGNALERRGVPFQDREAESVSLLERVGLAAAHLDQFPRQFSGGQRQRIGIARALAMQPSFIVADEPVSALDVSVQAQILNLLQRLQAESNVSFLLVSHDLAVVHHISQGIRNISARLLRQDPPKLSKTAAPYTRVLRWVPANYTGTYTTCKELCSQRTRQRLVQYMMPNKYSVCSDVERTLER